jgi:DNA-binding MarR family transcriptional regulator
MDRGRSLRRPAVVGWMRLARVYGRVDRASAALFGRWGLSVGQFDVLSRVGADEGLTQGALGEALLVTKGNVSQLLEKMEGRGLVTRRREGRTNRVYLTEEGRRLFAEAVPAQEEMISTRFSGLSRPEQDQLLRLLGKLERSVLRGEAGT